MQENTKFVGRVQNAIAELVVMNKAVEMNGMQMDSVVPQVRNLNLEKQHLEQACERLMNDGHLRKEGNKFMPTDDGRENVQKLQRMVVELPNLMGKGEQRSTAGAQGVGGTQLGTGGRTR